MSAMTQSPSPAERAAFDADIERLEAQADLLIPHEQLISLFERVGWDEQRLMALLEQEHSGYVQLLQRIECYRRVRAALFEEPSR